MITWMLLALLASVFLAGAGLAFEQTADLLRRPRRWGWLAAMLAAVGLPVLFRFLPAQPAQPASSGTVDPDLLAELLALTPAAPTEAGLMSRMLNARAVDPLLAGLWLALTIGLGVVLWIAYRRLGRVRASGLRVKIEGFPALLTEATGPVVIGVGRPEIVLPRWIESLSPEERRLVVQHEWEHVRAGDPRLLVLGALLVAAMPWNLPLWWMRARLRQAIEVDCDARVLASGADRRAYGKMLIQTAGRPSPAPLLAPALAELPSSLERRILAMTSRIPAHRRARIAAAATFGALLFVVACEMTPRGSSPSPTEPELADVMTPEVDGASERVMIRVLDQDSAGGRIIGGNISPEGEVTIVRVGPDGDTTEIRDGRIRVSPLSDLERDGARPLYIVDGERMESIAGLDPSRIVAIDVLKGDLAVQQYGPEAKDGVVQVRTGEPGGAVRVPLGDARASASREVVLDFAHDGAAVRLEEREPGESRIQVSIPDNPDARPLILVDGKPGSIEALDPSQILTIEVIKDADATAVYGPEAKDGVISVKTRPTAPARVRAPQPAEAPEKVETGAMVAPAKASGVAARSQAVEVVSSEVAALSEAVRASAPQVSDRAAEVEVARVQQAAARVQREAEVARVQREVEAVRAQREVEVTRVQQAAEVARAAANAQTIAGSIAEPLIIVEGEVISSRAELNDRFPPESIEAVRVLKDRAATDVYGERARNGVIIVELKD